jgi:hypothetical protein
MDDADIQRADLIYLPTSCFDDAPDARRRTPEPTPKTEVDRRMIYLASPYANTSPQVREHRFELACRVTANLMRAGQHVFSPIAHSHPIALAGVDAVAHDFWLPFDAWFVNRCDELWVLAIPGWRESRGVTWEINRARERGIPIRYVDAEGQPTTEDA